MAYVITQNCCKDASCIPVCPVDCIHPDPDWTPAPDDWWEEPATDDPYT